MSIDAASHPVQLRAGKKYLAEYVQNAAQAGMWEDIAAGDEGS